MHDIERALDGAESVNRKVAARFLVLPAEEAALPNVGPAVATTGLFGAALEAVVVRVSRLIDAEEFAEVVEMRLSTGPLSKRVVLPSCNELCGVMVLMRGSAGVQYTDTKGFVNTQVNGLDVRCGQFYLKYHL